MIHLRDARSPQDVLLTVYSSPPLWVLFVWKVNLIEKGVCLEVNEKSSLREAAYMELDAGVSHLQLPSRGVDQELG